MSNEQNIGSQFEEQPGRPSALAPEAAIGNGGEAGGAERGFASEAQPASPPLPIAASSASADGRPGCSSN